MKSKIICFLFLAAVLSSCSHDYYQIFTVTPLDAVKKNSVDNYLVYEDDICKVTYNFWGQGGWMGFAVYNKSDSAMFIDMPASHFVINDFAVDYYQGRTETYSAEYSTSVAQGYAVGQSLSLTLTEPVNFFDYDRSFGTASYTERGMTLYEGRVTKGRATAVVEQEVVIIPPHTYKFFSHYNIYNRYFFDGDKKTWNFTMSDSPIFFRNFLTIFVGWNKQPYMIDNAFYVSQVHELIEEFKSEPEVSVRKEAPINNKKAIDEYFSPNQFYVVYRK